MQFNFRGSALKLLQSTHPCGPESRQQQNRPGKRDFFTPSKFRVRLDRGSLPSETLESGSLKRGESGSGAEGAGLRGIYPLSHRSNVPLQVFSGETTPILGLDLRSYPRHYIN